VVIKGSLPDKFRNDIELYVGCVSGAIKESEYLAIIHKQGFRNIVTHKIKQISIPLNVLEKYATPKELDEFGFGEKGIFSITVSGYK
jgi:hypothetical protein